MPPRVLACQENARQVDVDDHLPLRQQRIFGGFIPRVDASVVDQHVDTSPDLNHGLAHGLDTGFVRDIGNEGLGLTTHVDDRLSGSLKCIGVAPDQCHLGASLSKTVGDRAAQAASTTGDDHYFALQVMCLRHCVVHCSPFASLRAMLQRCTSDGPS
ncbi:hypothetical protein D3C84_668490 [compost metagenome]